MSGLRPTATHAVADPRAGPPVPPKRPTQEDGTTDDDPTDPERALTRRGWTPLSGDEALLWMNDRCGERVDVLVEVDLGDFSTTVIESRGVLRHCSATLIETDDGPRYGRDLLPSEPTAREDIVGLYTVADGLRLGEVVGLDLTYLIKGRGSFPAHGGDSELSIELSEAVTLRIAQPHLELPTDAPAG